MNFLSRGWFYINIYISLRNVVLFVLQTGRSRPLSSRGSSCSCRSSCLWSTNGTRSSETSTPRREGEHVWTSCRTQEDVYIELFRNCEKLIVIVCFQGSGGGRASGARSGDEEEEIQQQRQMCPAVRGEERREERRGEEGGEKRRGEKRRGGRRGGGGGDGKSVV